VIRKEDILERARGWELRVDVVEKDYVLGWLLAALARNTEVKTNWVFKGGTCLKKCYFETYRFSEDLDFSLRPAAVYTPDALVGVLKAVAQDAHELSGIEYPLGDIKIVERHNKQNQPAFQGKVPYRGPLGRTQLANILFDLTQHEVLVDEADDRSAFHPYPDDLPDDLTIAAYSIEELFAEKTRALLERTRPRDLYDVVQIVENHSASIDFELAREFFHKKCAHKTVAPPGAAALGSLVLESGELKADWDKHACASAPGLAAHRLGARETCLGPRVARPSGTCARRGRPGCREHGCTAALAEAAGRSSPGHLGCAAINNLLGRGSRRADSLRRCEPADDLVHVQRQAQARRAVLLAPCGRGARAPIRVGAGRRSHQAVQDR